VTADETPTLTEAPAEPATPTSAPGESPASTGQPAAECSAAGLSSDLPVQELPEPVADKRQAIARAAVACDYEELEELAAVGRFTFSYGGSGSAADFWRDEEKAGRDVLATLVRLLELPHARNEAGFYAWPSAYSEQPSPRDWKRLEGIYDDEMIASFRRNGSYLGHRIGITPQGEWQFFVAGD